MIVGLIIKTFYLILPGIFANTAPILFKHTFKFLAVPIDNNKTWNNKPIFGKNKTWRGMILGILVGMLITYFQKYLYQFEAIKNISLINYADINILLLGFLLGFGALAGDLVKSFFKRRVGIAPGQQFVPWDQIDSAVGGLLCLYIVYIPPIEVSILIIIMAFFLSRGITLLGYHTGLRKEKW